MAATTEPIRPPITPSKPFRIALYPGDGIGREVTEAAAQVLEAVSVSGETAVDLHWFDWGCDHHARHGCVAPGDFLDTLISFDAIFLGAVGWPQRLPDHVTLAPLIEMRQAFDLYACVRPAKTFQGVSSLLANPGPIDMAVVRENSEGEYVAMGGSLRNGASQELAVESAVHTRHGIERILRFAFDLARTRRGKVTVVTKSNAMRYGYVLWDTVHDQVAADYPDVITDRQHVDAACMNFVRQPNEFDVVVGSNLFGDILTDLSGAITGSIGLNASANLNPSRQFPSLFEPVHGSAPDIAGQNRANPVGAILAIAMMLDWLGITAAGTRVRSVVEATLASGAGTPDIGGTLSTTEMTAEVVKRVLA